MVQKQWLNLYLFDINNFTIYKLLYYLSGLIVPIFVILNSVNKFTDYKFIFHKNNNNTYISGKLLLFLISIVLISLSTLISGYIFINLKLILNFVISNNNYLVQFDINKLIISVLIISILLIFKNFKLIIKKIILINFFIISIIIWYSQFNNSLSTDISSLNILLFENINTNNIMCLLSIEVLFYIWSYISYDSYLSDWRVPKPYQKEVTSIFNILIFYFLILLYYSILLIR